MKNFKFFCVFSMCILFACNEAPKNAAATASESMANDSTAVADAIHGFYKWYDAFSKDETKHINFTEAKNEHLVLNQSKLEMYYANFKNSGFVSNEFVEQEYAFYKKCEPLWQNERLEDVPSCMDADKYFCAQDWELDFWTTSPVRLQRMGADKVLATLYGTEAGGPKAHNFELKKEQGKWVLVKIECDMGVE